MLKNKVIYCIHFTLRSWIERVWAPFKMDRTEGFAEGLKAVADRVRLDDFRTRQGHDGVILISRQRSSYEDGR